MKTQNVDQFQELNIEKKIKGKSLEVSENDFTLLWPKWEKNTSSKIRRFGVNPGRGCTYANIIGILQEL